MNQLAGSAADDVSVDDLSMNESLNNTFDREQAAKGPVTRICEYCEVKLDNPQIEKFYEFGKQWRKREYEINEQKINWYEQNIAELGQDIGQEYEALTIAELAHTTEKTNINSKIDQVMSDKIRINGLKKTIETDVQTKILQNQDLDRQIDELQQRRTQLLIELDKVTSMFEAADKENNDLMDKIRVL